MVFELMRRIALQLSFAPLTACFALLQLTGAAHAGAQPQAIAGPPPPPMPVAVAPSTKPVKSAATAKKQAVEPEVALGGDASRTRFLIGLAKPVEFQVFSLSNPNRVVVELPNVAVRLPPAPEENIAVGLVRSFQAGAAGPGKTRVVIAVTRPVVVESAKLQPAKDGSGQRLALDIVPVETVSKQAKKPLKLEQPFGLGALGVQPPLPTRAVRPEVKASKAFKPIIVIDPGHGGKDSGAIKHGTVEKDVVLAFAKALKTKLEAAGEYKVMMTRDTDVFVELGDRVAFAEKNKANLFIAVHADYSDESSKTRGATIYSLRDSVASSLERSTKGSAGSLSAQEAQQVKASSADGDFAAVRNILADLVGREVEATRERTNVFTRSVIEYMGTSTELRSRPDQQAAFRVLKTAQFPSVLIELAYVTNKEDAALLRSDAWRDKVSDSIKTAVDNYFSSQIARLPM